jgi:type II secretion system protein N
MKERLRAIAPMVGFPIFYLFCLLVFSVWTFPFDKVKGQAVARFNQWERETGGQSELKIDELGSSWLNGVSFKGARLLSPASEPGKPPVEMKIDEGSVNVSLLGLLFGNHDVSFHLSAFGGTIKGEVDESSKERKVDVALEGVDLSQIPVLAQTLSVPVDGTLDGTIKVTVPDLKMTKATGSVALDFGSFSVGDGKAKLMGYVALPRVTLGALAIAGDIKDGVLKLSKLSAGGKDIELQGDGKVQLREQVADSFCDLNVRLKINDAYRGKSDTTKALFGEPGSTGPSTLELTVPQVKQAKRTDGFYGWHVHGLFSRPGFDPAPLAPTPGLLKGPGPG